MYKAVVDRMGAWEVGNRHRPTL